MKINVEYLTKKLEEFIDADNINKTVTEEQPLESNVLDLDMSLETLIRVNSGFKCNLCEKKIKTEKGLKRHMMMRHGFQYDFCEIRFRKEYLLKEHKKEEHHAIDGNTDDGYTCKMCEYHLLNTSQYQEVDDLDEYTKEELQEHLESANDMKKSRYDLRKK